MKRSTRRHAALVLGVALAATAAPAFAEGVDVSLQSTPGSRQFAVQNISGAPLTAINLGSGGQQPFRTVVTDTTFQNLTQGYNVNAKMNNLYLHNDTTPVFGTKVPSSEVSLQYGTSPLSALGLDLSVLPKVSVSGTLQSCAELTDSVKTLLGLSTSVTGVLTGITDPLLLDLCTKLGAADNKAVTGTVDGALQQVQPTINSLADLPAALSGAQPGPFTAADYANGIGAGDTAGATGAPAATSLGIMTGTPGITSALSSAIQSLLATALGSNLTAADDAGAKSSRAAAIALLSNSTDPAIAAVGASLSLLDATKQSSLLNTLTGTVALPVLGDIKSLSGRYYAFPILKATPTTPEPGVYKGTMTVTFVQQ